MQFLLTVLAFLVIFSILILVHEFGHFIVARRNGIKVEEFGFGLPPRIWGKKHGEVLYSINWIPFGGFVRMLGEDSRDKDAAKSPRSFMRKTKWQRTKVVCAGVFMNFLLAWVLLTVGFILGMQPLMVTGDDFLQFIQDDQIELAAGVYVDSVEEGSLAANAGFEVGDKIETLNGEPITDLAQLYSVMDSEESFTLNGVLFEFDVEGIKAGLGFNVFEMPRAIVEDVDEGLLQNGDVIWSINGEQVFYADDLYKLLGKSNSGETVLEISRGGEMQTITIFLPDEHRAIISHVFYGTPSFEAGVKQGDILLSVNGQEVWTPQQAVTIATESEDEILSYLVNRDGVSYEFNMERNDQGYVGVLLGLRYISDNQTFTFYDGIEMSSVLEIKDVQFPIYKAPVEAFVEMKRISVYTAVMVGQLFGNVFTTASVPEGVAGPVGIAQMTGLYVQEGFVALIRFLALLSLSLGVINIFPFPALDGGRMAFIVVEAIRGKPVDAKIEGMIHALGFIFLIAVIFLVTFQDIVRLF